MPELAAKTSKAQEKRESQPREPQSAEPAVALAERAPLAAAGTGDDPSARHAGLLGDARIGRMSVGQRAGLVRQLQRGYGNGHVARAMAQANVDIGGIQRKECPPEPAEPAPAAPENDPKFQKTTKQLDQTAAQEKKHGPAAGKAREAQDAAEGPPNEIAGQAATAQVGKMDQQQPGQFDREKFIQAVNAAIKDLMPKNLDDAEKFKNKGSSGVQNKAGGVLNQSKDTAEKDIKQANQEAPDASKAKPKPVTPMQPEVPGAPPGPVGAAGAMPQPKPPEEISLEHDKCATDSQMQEAGVTEAQLKKGNEPEFDKALETKQTASDHSANAPQEFRTQEKSALDQTKGEAEAGAKQTLAGMHADRDSAAQLVNKNKGEAKTHDTAERERISGELNEIYGRTKTAVEGILNGIQGNIDRIFKDREPAIFEAMKQKIDSEILDFKLKRYLLQPGGQLLWIKDQFSDPPRLREIVDEGVKYYEDRMQPVIGEIADVVVRDLNKAKDLIAKGRAEVQAHIAKQPASLQKIGQEAAGEIGEKFGQLESDVDSKHDELAQNLAQQYVEAKQKVDEFATATKEANKGLWQQAKDAVGGAIETITNLKNMLMGVLAKAAGVIDKIIGDPIGFLGNLLSGVKQGLMQFVGNIGAHLKKGLMSWLFGELAEAGIQLPASFDLKGILTLVMQVLGLTWETIRAQAVKILGPKVVGYLEGAFKIFMIIKDQGIGGLWEFIKEQLGNLKDMVLDGIKDMVISQVIQAGVEWLIGVLGGPAGAFIKAAKAIYNVVMWFVNNGARLAGLVNAVLDSVSAIANGALGQAANFVEGALSQAVPTAIGFLASLLGLGNLGAKIKGIIEIAQTPVKKAIGWVLGKAKGFAQKIMGKVKGAFGKKDKKNKEDERTAEQKQKDLGSALADATKLLQSDDATEQKVKSQLPFIKNRYKMTSLVLIVDSEENLQVDGTINPSDKTDKIPAKPTGKRPKWRAGTKERIIARDLAVCNFCGRLFPIDQLTIDHVVPWDKIKQGAKTRKEEIEIYHDENNLALLCKSCNSSKQDTSVLGWYWKTGGRVGGKR